MRTINLRDSYRFYQKNVEESINIKAYIDIVLGFIKFMMIKVFEGKDIKLPAELGMLGVRGRKVKPRLDQEGNIEGLAPDWVKTKELWKTNEKARQEKTIVYHFNEHTSGFRYKIVWFRKDMKFKNKSVYSIRFSRSNKRILSNLIKKGKEYTEGQYSR